MEAAGLETDEQKATTNVVEAMIEELDTADPNSMSFRYPADREASGGLPLLSDEFEYFDMQVFRDQARRLANFIVGCADQLDAYLADQA